MKIQELISEAKKPALTPEDTPDYGDQGPVCALIKKETGRTVYFDHTDLVDKKSSQTIMRDSFKKGTKIKKLIAAAKKFEPQAD